MKGVGIAGFAWALGAVSCMRGAEPPRVSDGDRRPSVDVTAPPPGPSAMAGSPCRDPVTAPPAERVTTPSACVLRASNGFLRDVIVPLRDGPMHLLVEDASIEASPRPQDPKDVTPTVWLDVKVLSPIAFTGVAEVGALVSAGRGANAGEFVQVGTRAQLQAPRVDGARMTGNVAVSRIVTARAAVACDALSLPPRTAKEPLPVYFGKRVVRPVGFAREITLHGRPSASDEFEVSGDDLVFSELQTRGEWSEISARWDDGTRVTGWVLTGALEAVPKDDMPMASVGGFAPCGDGAQGCGLLTDREYEPGTVTVRSGAPIHAAPDGEVWAKVPKDLELRVIREKELPGWIRIIELPGMEEDRCANIKHAYVAAGDTLGFRPEE